MTKILNVDALTKEERTLVLAGVEHVVLEMSVENFLATTKAAEELQDTNAPLTKQVESAVDLITRSVPTAPREVLLATPLRHLQTIVAFVRGDEVEAVPDATQSAPGVTGAKKARVRK